MKLHKRILDLLDKKYQLTFVDRNDDLGDMLEDVEKVIQTREYHHLEEKLFDTYFENECYGIDNALDELKTSIMAEFEVEEERAESFIEKYRDYIQDEINDRDESDTTKDLIRNTSEQIFYYHLEDGEISENYDSESYKESIKTIKKALGIKLRDSSYDRQINELIDNAGYGGNLEIFFCDNIDGYMPVYPEKKVKYITFKNPEVAIVNRWNGSGHNVTFKGLEVKVKFDWDNLRLDKNHGYSYTYDICGMISSWANSTSVKLA